MNDTYISKELVISVINVISNLSLTNIKIDNLNSDYEAFTFESDKLTFKSRLAKKTPKKKDILLLFGEKMNVM
ncbi:hypothetical protein [Staphylococcus schleiferi]|uniref:hypothetical protein n=1 Tax=Staphylococcus schleiferi TaxID=1295 RepID=UPI002B1ED7FE|nr:hypothetical protein [Staphylococcus schleiferi]